MSDKKVLLSENEIPDRWYNLAADLKMPLHPPRHPGTLEPLSPAELEPLFAKALIEQEISTERWIPIPDAVREAYRVWRPTPLIHATGLEAALGTPAEIWFKNEGVSPAGSHKPNSAIPQAYYNAKEGIMKLTTETGAGQWGSSLAYACAQFGVHCHIYMVRVSHDQKPYRASMMRAWGGEVDPSPSPKTSSGRAVLAEDPNSGGSLGIAISEAVEEALASGGTTHYALGSVLNHVLLHQTVIGLETRKQMEKIGRWPNVMIACCGGGSNFGGFTFPFMPEKIDGSKKIRFVAVEPAACPTLTRGKLAYDFGDTAGLTPLLRMFTLGAGFMPPGFHAGGLRYHGMAPLVSAATEQGLVEPLAVQQLEAFEAGVLFARVEGIMPAPESSHAIRGAIVEALRCKEEGKKEVIVFNMSGHGHMDMTAYDAYLSGKLDDGIYDEQALALSLSQLPKVG